MSRSASGSRPTSGTEQSVEPRWPIALAISAFIALTIALRILEPHHESLGPRWLVPGIEIAMFLTLIAADPARLSSRAGWLRKLAIGTRPLAHSRGRVV